MRALIDRIRYRLFPATDPLTDYGNSLLYLAGVGASLPVALDGDRHCTVLTLDNRVQVVLDRTAREVAVIDVDAAAEVQPWQGIPPFAELAGLVASLLGLTRDSTDRGPR